MEKIRRYFASNMYKFAGVFSDKGILTALRCTEQMFSSVAKEFGFEYFDMGQNFLVSRPEYCK